MADYILTPARREEFITLFKEFETTYPLTSAGEKHAKYYDSARQQAQENYKTLLASSEHGEDITDAVLMKLLPHKNTQGNRERGSWIHITSVLDKDVKTWFERAGWTKPEDWPNISRAILVFVQTCVEHPGKLAKACEDFSNLPYSKGFQDAFLTPILNALRPDEFVIINIKPRKVLNYFLEFDLSQSIRDYPEINSAVKSTIEQVEDVLHLVSFPDMIPGDVFDMFCHWLVAEKKYFAPAENKYAYPFSEIFGSSEEAEWAFNLLNETADRLGVQGADDPMVAITLPKQSGDHRIHMVYGNWLVLGISGHSGAMKSITLALFTNNYDLPILYSGEFKKPEGGTAVSLYEFPIEEIHPFDGDLRETYNKTLEYISNKFQVWDKSNYRYRSNPKLTEAVFDTEKRNQLLTEGMGDDEVIDEYGQIIRETSYWKIAPERGGELWDEWRKQGYISIGWEELGDLRDITRKEFEKRRDALIEGHPEWTRQAIDQVWKFINFQIGDRVIANQGTSKILGVGTVIGQYSFVPDVPKGHHIPMRWDDVIPKEIHEGGWRKTLIQLDREKFERLTLAPEFHLAANPLYPLSEISEETGIAEARFVHWVRAIKRKGQAILYGPPGTGKTFLAEKLARHLIGGKDGFFEIVQFHPAYSYEDFIQGIRPLSREDGSLVYPMLPGRFLDFCERAQEKEGSCILIIDEINRANLARVFGELMYLLEYRDREVPLAGGGKFSIPQNVLIIGTMNTADRSIALVDHALRRRFAFLALYPELDVLRRFHKREKTNFEVEALIDLIEQVNRRINDPHYSIGISYFLRTDLAEQIEDIWQMEIQPYLNEYFFDHPEWAQDYEWDKVKGRFNS